MAGDGQTDTTDRLLGLVYVNLFKVIKHLKTTRTKTETHTKARVRHDETKPDHETSSDLWTMCGTKISQSSITSCERERFL